MGWGLELRGRDPACVRSYRPRAHRTRALITVHKTIAHSRGPQISDRNLSSSAMNRPGDSWQLPWPTPGITTIFELGLDRRRASATSRGARLSCSPWTMSVGTEISGSAGRRSAHSNGQDQNRRPAIGGLTCRFRTSCGPRASCRRCLSAIGSPGSTRKEGSWCMLSAERPGR